MKNSLLGLILSAQLLVGVCVIQRTTYRTSPPPRSPPSRVVVYRVLPQSHSTIYVRPNNYHYNSPKPHLPFSHSRKNYNPHLRKINNPPRNFPRR
jgi:hypothetical protein